MKEQPVQEVHHGSQVWVNPTTETLRRTECLCLNCKYLQEPNSCSTAKELYGVCVRNGVALTVTRCPTFEPKKS